MNRYARRFRALLEAIGIAVIFTSPWICYFLEMKP